MVRLTGRAPPRAIYRKPVALLTGVTQFVIAVGNLEAINNQLETPGHGRIVRASPRKRRLVRRVIGHQPTTSR